jgi:hypothetical protein
MRDEELTIGIVCIESVGVVIFSDFSLFRSEAKSLVIRSNSERFPGKELKQIHNI